MMCPFTRSPCYGKDCMFVMRRKISEHEEVWMCLIREWLRVQLYGR